MAVVNFPPGLLSRQADQNLWLRGQTGSAGRGVDNREQLVFTENRIWRCRVDLPVLDDALRLEARKLARSLNGRVNPVRLEVCNRGTARNMGDVTEFYLSMGISQTEIDQGGLFYSDGATFGDGAGFALPDPREPIARNAAVEGASQIDLDRFLGRNLVPETRFSINDFLYQVASNDDGRVSFDPPLREDVPAGAAVNVSRPTVRLRLASDDGYEPFESYGAFVDAQSLEFEEDFDRVTV